MKKNILKNLIVLFSLIVILFGYNFVFADLDTVPPVITITGSNPMDVIVGSPFTDPGATATDDIDHVVTVVSTGEVNKDVIGTYAINYTVTDTAGNTTTSTRTVNITPVLSSIAIATPATKLSYLVGDSLDISGLIITGTYSDDSTKIETINSDNITGFDSSIAVPDKILTVTVGIQTVTYNIDIKNISKTEDILIRAGDKIIYQGVVEFPILDKIDILDDTNTIHSINAKSVLGLLYSLSQTSGKFTLSKIKYDSYLGLYLSCLKPSNQDEICNNWLYSINGVAPDNSMAFEELIGNEKVGIYFGSSSQIVIDKTSIATNESFIATAQNYNYLDNTWIPRTGIKIDTIVLNPSDPYNYNPTVLFSQEVDSNGSTVFTIPDAGNYSIGIAKDWYYPSYKVSIINPVVNSGGGGSITPMPVIFNVSNAISYLSGVQDPSGSFGNSSLYTDWAAIAASANNNSNLKSNILNYLKSNPIRSSSVTEYERRAMALMSLGVNPYSGTSVNYIEKIIDSFDGTQFGDSNLVNDDIFALVVLSNVGYDVNDEIITKDINYIISKQSNGSWGSVDMTAAAVQALYPFKSVIGVSNAISNASTYLESTQESNGGWGNVSSSSWATQAMNILGESWIKNNKTVYDYLGSQQAIDGAAISSSEAVENRIWATSYVVPAAMKLSWSDILNDFDKPIINSNNSSSSTNSSSEEFVEPIKIVDQVNQIIPEIIVPKINLDLPQKVINKKTALLKPVVNKPIELPSSSEIKTEVPSKNNLTASSGNAINTNFSIKEVSQNIINFVANFFHYVGSVFNNLLSLMHVF